MGFIKHARDFEQFLDGVAVRLVQLPHVQANAGFAEEETGQASDELDALPLFFDVV